MSLRPLLLSFAFLAFLGACDRPQPKTSWQGYVEVELTYVALPGAGEITRLDVARGDMVAPGQQLFSLDDQAEQAARGQALANVEKAKAELADLGKGERPEELAVIQAQINEAKASLALSEPRLARRKKMVTNNIVGEEELDAAQSAILSDRGRIEQYSARMIAAQLPARIDQIEAAKEGVANATAALDLAEWNLSRRQAKAPVAARVEDTLYRVGEFARAGDPVVALRADKDVKLRFYVPEPALSSLEIGGKVAIACDGCAPGLTATVNFIASEAEFTPPVIYSIGRRDKLVFLVEAVPDDLTQSWPAGLPVDVTPKPAQAKP